MSEGIEGVDHGTTAALTPNEWRRWFDSNGAYVHCRPPVEWEGKDIEHIASFTLFCCETWAGAPDPYGLWIKPIEICHNGDHDQVPGGSRLLEESARHGLAALALHDQPFGFTWKDVDDLRAARLDSIADRIEALLPPPDPNPNP